MCGWRIIFLIFKRTIYVCWPKNQQARCAFCVILRFFRFESITKVQFGKRFDACIGSTAKLDLHLWLHHHFYVYFKTKLLIKFWSKKKRIGRNRLADLFTESFGWKHKSLWCSAVSGFSKDCLKREDPDDLNVQLLHDTMSYQIHDKFIYLSVEWQIDREG